MLLLPECLAIALRAVLAMRMLSAQASLHPLNISTSVTFCVPEHKLVPFVFVLCSRTQPWRAVFVLCSTEQNKNRVPIVFVPRSPMVEVGTSE